MKNKTIVIKIKNLYPNDPVDRFRGVNIVKKLHEKGWNIQLYNGQKEIDILIFLDSLNVDSSIQAKKVILDIQDNHLNKNNSASKFILQNVQVPLFEKVKTAFGYGIKNSIKRLFLKKKDFYLRTIKEADYIICSSYSLQKYYSQFNKNCISIYDAVEVYKKKVKPKESTTDKKIKICWLGTKNNIAYLKIVEDVLFKLEDKYNFDFTIITSKDIFRSKSLKKILDSFRFKFNFTKWDEDSVYHEISTYDIAIAPLPKGAEKSTNKILTYMGLSVATVCSGASDYQMLHKKYPNAFLFIEDNEQENWRKALESLILDSCYRDELIENGYELSKKFSLDEVVKLYEELFYEVLKKDKQ